MPSDFSDKWSSRLISAARTSLTAALLSVSPAAKAQDMSEGMTLAKLLPTQNNSSGRASPISSSRISDRRP